MTLFTQSAAPGGETTDAKRRLVDAIAADLWSHCAHAGILDWPEVDRHLGRIVEQARGQARLTPPGLAPSVKTLPPATRLGLARRGLADPGEPPGDH
jgi:hypothetical protein